MLLVSCAPVKFDILMWVLLLGVLLYGVAHITNPANPARTSEIAEMTSQCTKANITVSASPSFSLTSGTAVQFTSRCAAINALVAETKRKAEHLHD